VSPDGEPLESGGAPGLIVGSSDGATRTARLMQPLVGAHLLVGGLLTTLLSYVAVPSVRQATEKSIRVQRPDLSVNEVRAIVEFGVTVGLALAVVAGLVLVGFGVL